MKRDDVHKKSKLGKARIKRRKWCSWRTVQVSHGFTWNLTLYMAVVSRNSLVPRGGHCYRVTREPSRGLKKGPAPKKLPNRDGQRPWTDDVPSRRPPNSLSQWWSLPKGRLLQEKSGTRQGALIQNHGEVKPDYWLLCRCSSTTMGSLTSKHGNKME